jgi:hypothetical protein
MPSVSKKQHNFMNAIANNKAFAKKVGIPQSVGQEFAEADKGKKFKQGGIMKHSDLGQDKKMVKKAVAMHDKQLHGGKKTNLATLKKGGSTSKMVKMASGGRVKKMADGGTASPFGNTPLGGSALGAQRAAYDANALSVSPSYGGGNQGGAYGGLQSVNQGAGQIGQSLNTIQGALGGRSGGAQSAPDFGNPQTMYKKGGKVMKMAKGGKVKKMADGGMSAPLTQQEAQSMTPAYGGGNQGGAFGGLNQVNQGSRQVGQSLGTIQGALGGNGGQGLGRLGGVGVGVGNTIGGEAAKRLGLGFMKKGGKVKAKKMAMGGAPVDPRAAAMAAKKAAMARGAKRGMPIAGREAPQMGGMPQGKPMMGRMPPQAGMPMPTMKKGGVAKKVTKEMEYDYKTGKKSFAGTTAQRDAHAEKEGKRVAKDLAFDMSKGMKKGGMSCAPKKMARGGGIETKGKTKGKMIKMAAGGSVGSASKRADGCAVRGKTRA